MHLSDDWLPHAVMVQHFECRSKAGSHVGLDSARSLSTVDTTRGCHYWNPLDFMSYYSFVNFMTYILSFHWEKVSHLWHYCYIIVLISWHYRSQNAVKVNRLLIPFFIFIFFWIFRSSQRDNTLQVFHKYLRRGCLCPSFRRRIQRQLLINSRRHDIVHTFHHECREGSPSMLHLCLPFLQYMIRSLFANSLDWLHKKQHPVPI